MNNLRSIRKKVLNMTMDELKDEMQISRQLLYTWETGKAAIPEKRLKQLEQITGIPKEFFVIENVSEEKLIEIKYRKIKTKENRDEDRWMIINTKMFIESPQMYIDMAKNGINIYIQLDNGNKLKLGKHM